MSEEKKYRWALDGGYDIDTVIGSNSITDVSNFHKENTCEDMTEFEKNSFKSLFRSWGTLDIETPDATADVTTLKYMIGVKHTPCGKIIRRAEGRSAIFINNKYIEVSYEE